MGFGFTMALSCPCLAQQPQAMLGASSPMQWSKKLFTEVLVCWGACTSCSRCSHVQKELLETGKHLWDWGLISQARSKGRSEERRPHGGVTTAENGHSITGGKREVRRHYAAARAAGTWSQHHSAFPPLANRVQGLGQPWGWAAAIPSWGC